MTVSDEIIEVGGRIYVKATATIKSEKEAETATAYAREEETKKGMDAAQITGLQPLPMHASTPLTASSLLTIPKTQMPPTRTGKRKRSPSRLRKKIAAAESKTALTGLWNTLSAEEQKKHTALFSKRKTEL